MAWDIRRERDERPGLYCVELRTQNWDSLVEWYRQALGLRVLVRMVDDGYALLEAGETRVALLRRAKTESATARISLAFEVSDVPGIVMRMEKFGSRTMRQKIDDEGLREVTVVDPDGNQIRLFAWPKNR